MVILEAGISPRTEVGKVAKLAANIAMVFFEVVIRALVFSVVFVRFYPALSIIT